MDVRTLRLLLSLAALASGLVALPACHGGEHKVTIERSQPGGGGNGGGGPGGNM